MSEKLKAIEPLLKEIQKENARFCMRSEEMSAKLAHDYRELMRAYRRMQERSSVLLEKCQSILRDF